MILLKKSIPFLIWLLLTGCTAKKPHSDPNPVFSWDKVQQFGFITITPNNPLTTDQIKFLAENYAIVTLNKQKKTDDIESIMPEVSAMAKELKSYNPRIKILCYLNTVIAIPGSSITHEFLRHPELALTDSSGNFFLIRNLKTFDLSNQAVREFWAAGAAEMTSYPYIDGIFADAVPKYGMKNHPDMKKSFMTSKMDELSKGEYELLRLVKEKIGKDKLLIFNGIRGDLEGWSDGGIQFLDPASGCLVEHFCAFTTRNLKTGKLKTEMVVNDIELIRKASEMGKIVLVKGWPGHWNWLSEGYDELTPEQKKDIAEEHIEFALAAFLIAAEKNCYFEYSFGYRMDGGMFEHYEMLDRKIGNPSGKAKKEGLIYTREFKYCKIWLDIDAEEAEITWKE